LVFLEISLVWTGHGKFRLGRCPEGFGRTSGGRCGDEEEGCDLYLRILALFVLLVCLGCGQTIKNQAPAIPIGPVEDLLIYDTPPSLVSSTPPEYPDGAREVGAEGRVILKLLVLEDGKVGGIQVMESPHPILTERAVAAVANCVFTPAMHKGLPVKATVVMPFVFSLNRSFQRTSVTSEPSQPTSSGAEPTPPPRPEEPPPPASTKQR
jgi:TonB family protein